MTMTTRLTRGAGLALAALLALSACEGVPIDQRTQGQILGGATGAVLGSTIGGGTGRVVATGAGAVLGTMVGGNIADRMD
ncbi:MAG: glycine zipper 2TM domain-containing protein [Rubrimonas sp.]|uniref:glycine zipper 2TM domain-containing protein n=1 Tax=Rubrimonas sp. TaxID=2036015 RepID=UPI002FDCFC27